MAKGANGGKGQATMTEALVPARLRAHPLWKRLAAAPATGRDVVLVVAGAAVVFVPFLGSVGLWDPWETHYAEVARAMIVREDYVHPYWESAYFFSKPVLSMWLMALGMNLVGALEGPAGAMSIYTEWAVRLPFALLAIWGAVAVFLAASRIWSRRVGLLAATALCTMPVYALIARQAMTDMPFVALTSSALCCFMIAVFGGEEDAPPSPGWLYAFYALCGFATLAKGLLGFALPGAVIFAYTVTTGEWRRLLTYRIPTGSLVLLAIAAPWYLVMSLFGGKDDEFKTFAYRFFVHDHFKRLATGVHTTTPGGTFVYYLEQLGFGTFPWVAAIPGGLWVAGDALRGRLTSRRERATWFVVLWVLLAWILFTLAATKFHHYAFPLVVPLAILCALFLDRLWEDGLDAHRVALVLGLVLFAAVAQNLTLQPKHLADLFVYNYGRPYPHREVDPQRLLAAFFTLGGAAVFAGWLWRSRRILHGAFVGVAVTFALWVSWAHWVDLSPHWSQRDLFWRYYHAREGDEPIVAYYMNWRGETFYSQNSVIQLKNASRLREIAAEPGDAWVLVEQGRFKGMQSAVQGTQRARVVDRSNNKFYLVRLEDRD